MPQACIPGPAGDVHTPGPFDHGGSHAENPLRARRADSAPSCCLAFALAGPTAVAADDWPGFRGPAQTGAVAAPGLFEAAQSGSSVAWRRPYGSGYSGIAVRDGVAYTLFSDPAFSGPAAENGGADLLVAVDAASGAERWRLRLGPFSRGHDGSQDGPLATPAVDRERVYTATTGGRLVAVERESGREAWSVDLVAEAGIEVPLYGYASTPLLVADTVVVATPGSKRGALAAFDRRDGGFRWSATSGGVEYQSPALAELAGREQILFWTADRAYGLTPDGTVLWEVEYGPHSEATPLAIAPDRFLLYGPRSSAMYRLEAGDDGLVARQLWESRRLKGGNLSLPVYHDGHLYGFDRAFLTCIDAETGEARWKSRPPGGSGLILVEDRLAVHDGDGEMVIVRASPEGYQEEARLPATARPSETWPAFADGLLFVRDKTELAAVRITDRPVQAASAEPEAPAILPGTLLDRLARQVAEAPDKRLVVDHFFRSQQRFPIREGDVVHFVYRGPASDVALLGGMLDQGEELPLERLEGTDLFVRSLRADAAVRLEYRFRVDFDQLAPDPLNPRRVPWYGGSVSEALPEEWRDPRLPGALGRPARIARQLRAQERGARGGTRDPGLAAGRLRTRARRVASRGAGAGRSAVDRAGGAPQHARPPERRRTHRPGDRGVRAPHRPALLPRGRRIGQPGAGGDARGRAASRAARALRLGGHAVGGSRSSLRRSPAGRRCWPR
jgi:outer membrane protein assembly factor BamB